jgi:hypothetical protein
VKRALLILPLVLAGCGGGGSGTPTITIAPAHQWTLVDTSPATGVAPGPVTVGFTVQQPSGKPLTHALYKTGAGPHTGVHVIVVKDDLSTIVHRHPPIAADGHVSERIDLPSPGNYTVLTDIYPNVGPLPNFQLRYPIHVTGSASNRPLPPFKAVQTVDGYTVDLHGKPKLRVAEAKILKITVTAPNGKPAPFQVYYGALAHAIFFQQGTRAYFHTHVCGPNTPGCTSIVGQPTIQATSTKPGVLHAGILLPGGGTWELFLQFKTSGKILTVPYTLTVQ